MQDPQTLFQEGVRTIRDRRDLTLGRKLLAQSLKLDPNNDAGWVWLAQVQTDTQRQLQCLERALKLNPDNAEARQLKQRLQAAPPAPENTSDPKSKNAESADPESLGQVTMSAGIRPLAQLRWGCFVVVCALFALMFFPPQSTVDPNIKRAGLFVSALFGIGVIWNVSRLVLTFGLKLTLAEGGLILSDGFKKQAWRWNEFTGVRVKDQVYDTSFMAGYLMGGVMGAVVVQNELPGISTASKYDLRLFIGNKCVVHVGRYFRDHLRMGRFIEAETAKALMPGYRRRLEAGETLEFGKIEVSRRTIQIADRVLKWHDIYRVMVERGSKRRNLILFYGAGTAAYDINDVTNAHVLVALIERLTGVTARQVELDSKGEPVAPPVNKQAKTKDKKKPLPRLH